MEVVRFLERKSVIRFFGVALILAPFINIALHIIVLKYQSHTAWSELQIWPIIRSGNLINHFLVLCSVGIGAKMLGGSTQAWKFVLILLGSHLLIQILNINNKAWNGFLAWPTFLLNAGLFFFIMDQLVWKIVPQVKSTAVPAGQVLPLKSVLNLKSYRKILFSFGSDKPWGELKTLSSEMLEVKGIASVPSNIENQTVQINFAKDVVVDIKFDHQQDNVYYFKPLNMDKDKVTKLNKWLKKIAV